MNKEDIKAIVSNYPEYCDRLKLIEHTLLVLERQYFEKYNQQNGEVDFRAGTFGRMSNAVIANRFMIERTCDYIKMPDWENDFILNYVPEPGKAQRYLGHFQGIDNTIRFDLFHRIYHILETYIRIIRRKLNDTNSKPYNQFEYICSKFGCFTQEYIEYINAVRNTIHNNGHYFPEGKQRKNFTFGNIGISEGEIVEVTTFDILDIVHQMIINTDKLFKAQKISEIPFLKDN